MRNTPATEFGDDLEQIIRETRTRLRKNAVRTGAGAVVSAALAWLLLAAVVDMLLPLPVPLRTVAAVGFWIILAGTLVFGVLWQAIRPLRLDSVAYRIERTLPTMHNRLITVLDVRRHGRPSPQHRPFIDRLLEQTRSRLADFRIEQVASPRAARLSLAGGIAAIVCLVLLCGLMFDRAPIAIHRVLRPTRAIAPVSWVQLDAVTGNAQVLQGEPVTIRARVRRGRVEGLTCSLRATDGAWHNYPMRTDDEGGFAHTIGQVIEPYEYQIRGGGTWTASHRIVMIRRPTVEKLIARIHLPEYLADDEPRPVGEHATQISAPVGSRVALAAFVAGEVASGRIELFKSVTVKNEHQLDNEIVWFDDDLPPDAEPLGVWRWVRDDVFSGTRAHTFDWSRNAYGFSTRMNRLAVAADGFFFAYVRLDANDPPSALTITLGDGGKSYQLRWTDQEPSSAPETQPGTAFAGVLPEPGRWVRLAVAIERLAASPAGPPKQFGSITFAIDGGRILFDRTGLLERTTSVNEDQKLEPTGTIALSRRPETGEWTGMLPVEGDLFFGVAFENGSGHQSAAMKPMPVVATEDQPPMVLVEKPSGDLMLDEPVQVPLSVRAFDDWGVRNVAIQFGDAPDQFGDPKPISAFDEPRISRAVLHAIDSTAQKLEAGGSLYYRLVVEDFKGQSATSPPLRISVASPDADRAQLARRAPPLKGLLEGITGLITMEGTIVGDVAALIAGLVPAALPRISADGFVRLLNPDGTPMTSEQIGELFDQSDIKLTDEQQKKMAELSKQLAKHERMLRELQMKMAEAAGAAAQSPLAMPQEMMLLQQMADKAIELSQTADRWNRDAESLARLAELEEQMPQMSDSLAELESQLRRIEQSRLVLGDDPVEAYARMTAMMAMMDGRGAMYMLDDLGRSLARQKQALSSLREQLGRLQERAAEEPVEKLGAVSNEQQQLDAESIEEMERTLELLRRLDLENDAGTPMAAPWMPPRRRSETMPVEADTPEEDPIEGDQDRTEPEDPLDQEDENWWDRRAPFPDLSRSDSFLNERFAGRNRPIEASRRRRMATPRQLLQEHQQRLADQLTQNSNDLGQATQQSAQMASQLQSLLSALQSGGESGGRSGERMDAIRQLQQMLASPQLQQMMALSQQAKAMMGQLRRGLMMTAGGSGTALDGFLLDMGPINMTMSTEQRATVYRLPPSLRAPLLQGMTEQGPEGYQDLIDAYFRSLSEEIE